MDFWGRSLDEATHGGVRAVPPHDLVQSLGWRGLYAVRRRRHVAEHECVNELGALKLELALKLLSESTFLSFEDGTGVMGHKANDPLVRPLCAEEPGAVERVKACDGQLGRIPDVMEHCGGFQELRILAENWGKGPSALGDPEGMRPPPRQRVGQQ
ncbi:hypothetical protein SAMN02745898_10959 [Streptomyces sp. 136MFCol5.1]|nr:hypothetical protein SAMN02745898_10959 [Streptomyces sp. 136MFCol5.1]